VALGKFKVEFFPVCHSIPDAAGLIIHTPVGTVVHSGDFKLDYTPVDGKPTDLSRLAQLGAQGVLLLLSDSTYAELPGYTPSERLVGETLDRVMTPSPRWSLAFSRLLMPPPGTSAGSLLSGAVWLI
jgi:ribonuclease J